MFLGHPGQDESVTIILQDIDHEDVECVLEFVYTGAAVVPGHRMDGFVTAAGALGIGPLLDPRRHLAVSAVAPPPPTPAPTVDHRVLAVSYEHQPRPPAATRPRQIRHPRTTGILTPSPWTQNSRPPCAAPKYSAPRTDPCNAAATVAAAQVRKIVFPTEIGFQPETRPPPRDKFPNPPRLLYGVVTRHRSLPPATSGIHAHCVCHWKRLKTDFSFLRPSPNARLFSCPFRACF